MRYLALILCAFWVFAFTRGDSSAFIHVPTSSGFWGNGLAPLLLTGPIWIACRKSPWKGTTERTITSAILSLELLLVTSLAFMQWLPLPDEGRIEAILVAIFVILPGILGVLTITSVGLALFKLNRRMRLS